MGTLVASRRSADQVIDDALNADISELLELLGHPPLVKKIFPNGWEGRALSDRKAFHGLCLRTIAKNQAKGAA